jgi:alcohol dehydrogenase class IV
MLGPGAHEMIGPEALKLGFKKSLVMTSGLRGSDIIHKITESMKYHGLEVVVYDQVESNPKDYNVMDAVASTSRTSATASSPSAAAPRTTPARAPASPWPTTAAT